MLLFAELAHLVDAELLEHSSIEWEERIYLHTVMVKNLGIDKMLPSHLFEGRIETNQSTRVTISNESRQISAN